VRYVVTFLYEAFNEQQKQLDMMSNIVTMMAKLNKRTLDDNASLKDRVHDLEHFGDVSGVDVSSVAQEPEDD
jgi:hypothetical protein